MPILQNEWTLGSGELYGAGTGDDKAAIVYFAEGSVQIQGRRARVHWAQGDLPNEARAAIVYMAEGSAPEFDRAGVVYMAEGSTPSPVGASFGAIVGDSELEMDLTQKGLVLTLAGGVVVAGKQTFKATRGDTRPVRALLKDEDGNLPDLSGSTVNLLFGDSDFDLIFTGTATGFATVQTDEDGEKYNVEYGFAASDLDRDADTYLAQWKVTLSDGTVIHWPSGSGFKIKISEVVS